MSDESTAIVEEWLWENWGRAAEGESLDVKAVLAVSWEWPMAMGGKMVSLSSQLSRKAAAPAGGSGAGWHTHGTQPKTLQNTRTKPDRFLY